MTSKTHFNTSPCVERLSPPFASSEVSFFAVNYEIRAINLSHPCFSQIPIPKSLANAVEKRKIEYVIGRYCAMNALIALGFEGQVGRFPDRSPAWPKGIIGSITHTQNFSQAAVATNSDHYLLGIDTETILPSLKISHLSNLFITKEEIEIGIKHFFKEEVWLYTVFSLKESIYKSIYPKIGTFFDFFDVEITGISIESGKVFAQLKKPLGHFPKNYRIECSYKIDYPRVHTLVLD